jgi:hypothetical protein
VSDQVEQFEGHHEAEAFQPDETGPVQMTGNDEVDAVLRSLGDLEGRPVQEHVAVFESAHEALRAALAGAGERPAGSATS